MQKVFCIKIWAEGCPKINFTPTDPSMWEDGVFRIKRPRTSAEFKQQKDILPVTGDKAYIWIHEGEKQVIDGMEKRSRGLTAIVTMTNIREDGEGIKFTAEKVKLIGRPYIKLTDAKMNIEGIFAKLRYYTISQTLRLTEDDDLQFVNLLKARKNKTIIPLAEVDQKQLQISYSDIQSALLQGGFHETHNTSKVSFFENPTFDTPFYLKHTDNFQLVAHPEISNLFPLVSDIDGVEVGKNFYHNSHMTVFPKHIHQGKREIHYGTEIGFVSVNGLENFFSYIIPQLGETDENDVLRGREKSIVEICNSIENTVRNSNGQIVERTVKDKELKMTSAQLKDHVTSLYDFQKDRCALTGLKFSEPGTNDDKNLLPSPDRIDSNGHYEEGNLQLVCRFINFWKSDTDNEEFKRLLMLVRDTEFE